MSKNTQISELINYISVDGSGNIVFTTVPAASSNTDKFLVSDAGVLKFRTAAQLLSDIGAQASLINPVLGTASAGQVAYWSSGSAITGESNLFWDATNDRLGIGTIVPSEALTVNGSLVLMSAQNSFTQIIGTTLNPLAGRSNIKFNVGVDNIGGFLTFETTPSSSTSLAEVMRITTDAKVGIGTATPDAKLQVSTTDNLTANFQNTRNGATQLFFGNNFNFDATNFTNYSTTLFFRGDKQNRYTSAGVVIGPLASIATIYDNTTFSADSQQGAGALVFSTRQGTATTASDTLTERMRITSTGAATFTTTENQGGVYVTSATDNTTLRVASTATGGQEWRLQSTGGTSGLGQGKLVFKVGGTETVSYIPLTLTTDNSTNGGRVGINNTNPDANLVIGNLNTYGKGTINGASGTINRAIINCPYPGASALTLAYYSSAYGLDIWVNGDGTGLAPAYIDQRNSEAIIFRRNTYGTAAETMRLTGGGNVGIGASSLLEKLGVNGNIHVEGVGNSIYFDTDGTGRSIQQYVANQYQFHIVNARGNSARFILGNSSISLGTSSTPQFTINTSTGASSFVSTVTSSGGFIGSLSGNASTATKPGALAFRSGNFSSGTANGTENVNISSYYLPYFGPVWFYFNVSYNGNGAIQANWLGLADAHYFNNGTANIIWADDGASGGASMPSVSVSVQGSTYDARYLRVTFTATGGYAPNNWNWNFGVWNAFP
jgi:hypothetical protein